MNPAPPPAVDSDQLRALQAALARSGLSLEQLWLRYFALGGDAGPVEVEAHLSGLMALSALQGDMLAQAVNERLDELAWTSRIPYARTLPEPVPQTGPLAALVTVLDGSRWATPERLPALAAAGARALGAGVTIFLADAERRRLLPLGAPGAARRNVLAVDGTLAGRAYREGVLLPAVSGHEPPARDRGEPGTGADPGGPPSLWVPLFDGAHRLGVLEVTLPPASDPQDPAVREQCRWLSLALGRLVTVAQRSGDALPAPRRPEPSPAGELIDRLLPPPACHSDRIALAAAVASSRDVGGDVFDYALSETRLAVAVFDAMGRALSAGLQAAAALSAYRSARRSGDSLVEQAATIDRTIADGFPDTFLTGVLCDLDLETGRLEYLAAGHPYPRLVRPDRTVAPLTAGRRLPFGFRPSLAGEPDVPGSQTLRPGDRLALHTGGLVDARDAAGDAFGEDRLDEALVAAATGSQPAAETVRRLVHRVEAHRGAPLAEDATLLLACWDGPGQRFGGPTPG